MTPEEKAREIIGRGGQVLLPIHAGDAAVSFPSRWELAKVIVAALRETGRVAYATGVQDGFRLALPEPEEDARDGLPS